MRPPWSLGCPETADSGRTGRPSGEDGGLVLGSPCPSRPRTWLPPPRPLGVWGQLAGPAHPPAHACFSGILSAKLQRAPLPPWPCAPAGPCSRAWGGVGSARPAVGGGPAGGAAHHTSGSPSRGGTRLPPEATRPLHEGAFSEQPCATRGKVTLKREAGGPPREAQYICFYGHSHTYVHNRNKHNVVHISITDTK